MLGTAHPAKFLEVLQAEGIDVELPEPLAKVQNETILSQEIGADYAAFREILTET